MGGLTILKTLGRTLPKEKLIYFGDTVNVPYGSLQSVITKDRLQRVELSNYRSIGAMLAQAPVLILLPMLLMLTPKAIWHSRLPIMT